jgi:HEAT repeat protein
MLVVMVFTFATVWAQAQDPDQTAPTIPALLAKIDGSDSDARENTAHTLARRGSAALEPLIEALRHRDPKVRGVAARALELMGKKAERAVPALIACLSSAEPPEDPKPVSQPSFPEWSRAGEPRPTVCQRALGEIGEAAVRALVNELNNPDQKARIFAIRALGFMFDEKKLASPRLTALLDDPALRFDAATALGGIAPAPRVALPRLFAALKDADPAFRARAAETIGRIGWARSFGQYSTVTVARGAVGPLCESLKDPDPRVRAAAAIALGDIGPEAGVAATQIIEMFHDPAAEVRLAAFRAFHRNGGESVENAGKALPLLKDADIRIRRAAFGVVSASALNNEGVRNTVISALEDQDEQVKRIAFELLKQALRSAEPASAIASSRATGDALRRCLSRRDDSERRAAARLLAHFPSQAAETVPLLIERLDDDDPEMREAAARSLGSFGPKAAAAVPPLFERLLESRRNLPDRLKVAGAAAASIIEIDPNSADEVIRRLKGQLADRDEEVAAVALKILADLGPRGLPIVWQALGDEKTPRRVRADALSALVWIYHSRNLKNTDQAPARDPDAARAVPVLRELVRKGDRDLSQPASELLAQILSGDDEVAEFYFTAIHVKNLNRRMSPFNLRDRLKPPVLPFLIQRLNDPDALVRAEILRAIFQLANSLARPTDTENDEQERPSPTPEEREQLAQALRLKMQASRAIVPLLKDPDPTVRWNAAALLGKLGVQPKVVVPALMELLRTEKGTFILNDRKIELTPLPSRYFGLGIYTLPRAWPVVDEVRFAVVCGLGQFGVDAADAVPELATILGHDKDLPMRWYAATAIHDIGPAAERAVPALIELLRSRDVALPPPDPDRDPGEDDGAMPMRLAAAVALGGIGRPASAALPRLVQAISDTDAKVRTESAWAIGQIGADAAAAIPTLVKLTETETDEAVADECVHALGKIGSKAVPILTEHIAAGDPDVRIRFVTALGEVGPAAAAATARLAKAAVDPDEEIRTAAVEALGSVGKGPSAQTVVPILLAALKDSDGKVRQNAVLGLDRIGQETEQIVAALIAALRDPDVEVKSDAEYAICKIGVPALPGILALLSDPSETVSGRADYIVTEIFGLDPDVWNARESQKRGLSRLKAARFVLISALSNPNERIRNRVADVLANLGEFVVPDLVKALSDRSPITRAGAARTLELMGPVARPALDALRECLNDPDALVRGPAESAIKQILKPASK